MLLLELFNNPSSFIHSGESPLETYKFTIDEKQYTVSFAGGNAISLQFNSPKGQSITGEGDAIQVFSNVLKCVDDFMKRRDPLSISFGARKNQPSRVKLYNKLAERFAKKFSNYTLHVDRDETKDVFYHFTKK
ncbi:hypothetical protein [Acinetobacter sp.]|uniref:hypothetical protein n=1 Tax=Acinetobacter sp. TaxID=472 RepID=UPI00388FDB11